MNDEKREKGRALLEQLCGDPDAINSFPKKFLDYTLEHLFGDVWQGDALSLEERELVTCTILTALAREPEQQYGRAEQRGGVRIAVRRATARASTNDDRGGALQAGARR